MANVVTLSEAKDHLRITATDEDTIIQTYIDASEKYIENYINSALPGSADSPTIIPEDIKASALLIIADMYENRNGASEKDLKRNPAVNNLLYPYRIEIGI